ncbi:MAG: hypothetical protein EA001_02350 [Oscillatoriales cyanobacterium]|nr:MAG: hypothetical protein EA001_02350 [Oscillatoriales cyanobacterium]
MSDRPSRQPSALPTATDSPNHPSDGAAGPLTAAQIQETVYNYLIELVQTHAPEYVLDEFYRLFLGHQGAVNQQALHAIYQLIFLNDRDAFHVAIKRTCYILINNWISRRYGKFIYHLIDLFDQAKTANLSHSVSHSVSLNRLREWVHEFIQSDDFEELKLFAARHEIEPTEDVSQTLTQWTPPVAERATKAVSKAPAQPEPHWSSRYVGQLLVAQSADPDNPKEQREAAAIYARQWRERFKFDLAMYMAKSQSLRIDRRQLQNPTNLGDRVLKIVKSIVLRTGNHSYVSLANLFLQQTQGLQFSGYKKSLLKYLILENVQDRTIQLIRQKLQAKLDDIFPDRYQHALSDWLHQQTCRELIEFLTTEDLKSPSRLFLLILSNGSALTLAIFLLKLVLICPSTRSHLDLCIARLVKYYEQFDEQDCRWVVYFFDIFNVTFAIHTENVRYNLVPIDDEAANGSAEDATASDLSEERYDLQLRRSMESPKLDRYRLFLQTAASTQLPSTGDLFEEPVPPSDPSDG